jgi:hypothetical protein
MTTAGRGAEAVVKQQPLFSVTIPSATSGESGPVEYVILLTCSDGRRWTTSRRYSAFERLHQQLLESHVDAQFCESAMLPGKTLFSKRAAVVESRRLMFERYLQTALLSPVARAPALQAFLGMGDSEQLVDYDRPMGGGDGGGGGGGGGGERHGDDDGRVTTSRDGGRGDAAKRVTTAGRRPEGASGHGSSVTPRSGS